MVDSYLTGHPSDPGELILQLFSGIGSISNSADTGGVAYMAHIGGFVAGCVQTLLLRGGRTATA
jgi:membrane associated rhomboid family serine protease